MINLRRDYGSTWEGDVIIRNCTLRPCSPKNDISILYGSNDGSHDFGYPCQLPSSITIEGLLIDDSEAAEFEGYTGPSVFNSFGRTPGQAEPFPFGTKCNITLKGISVVSKKPLVIARNPDAFPGLVVVWE